MCPDVEGKDDYAEKNSLVLLVVCLNRHFGDALVRTPRKFHQRTLL